MKGSDLTPKQITAAEQYILRRRTTKEKPLPEQRVSLVFKDLVMLVAEYGAIRAQSMLQGGSVEEPGEVYFTGKSDAIS